MVKEHWNSRLGIILAVAGSAVGLGNYLRFPSQAAQYGGGAFLVAYLISFLIIGLPLCWAEWTMGRYGGQRGFHSMPGILNAIWRNPMAKYFGVLGVILPLGIYIYYVYVEAWCLGYAVNFLRGGFAFKEVSESTGWWANFIGVSENGGGFGSPVLYCLLIAFVVNFILIYRGLSKGIEKFCNIAMPTLMALSIIILIRVLTLGTPDASAPERSINNGLGFLWNPTKIFVVSKNTETGVQTDRRELLDTKAIQAYENQPLSADGRTTHSIERVSLLKSLINPQLWLAAAAQIFFSISAGFGIIIVYASYLTRKDDVVLSTTTAAMTNEFCEVALGGLITIPAAVAFLGVSGLVGAGLGTFDLGFKVLPMVFVHMPAGNFFGAMFFFLLFLAAMTSSISMLQPVIAFLEETLNIGRKVSVALLGALTALGAFFVFYFSKDLKAMDTIDFWVGTFLIFIVAMTEFIIFAWVFGVDRGFKEAHHGSFFRIPNIFKPILRWVAPLFLLVIFVLWIAQNVISFGGDGLEMSSYVRDVFVEANPVALMSLGLIALFFIIFALIAANAKVYKDYHRNWKEENQ